jgi:hypothetical protein
MTAQPTDALPPIPVYPSPEDFTRLATLAELVLSGAKEALTRIVREAAENDPTALLQDANLVATIDAHLSDLAGDVAGTLNQVAERLLEERYDGAPRGPMFRRRT